MRQVKSLWKKKEVVEDEERPELDVHFKLMRQYPEASQWWFAVVTLLAFVFGVVACEVYDTTMPVWGIVLTMALAAVFLVPAGIIFAISVSPFFPFYGDQADGIECSNHIGRSRRDCRRSRHPRKTICQHDRKDLRLGRQVFLCLLSEFITDNPALIQALLYVQDQKLAHYLHVPPRATFRAQMLGCLLGSLVSIGIINWQMSAIPDLCQPGQKDLMTCPYYVSFRSTSGT